LLLSRRLAVDAATKHLILIKALLITLPLELREQLEGLSDGRLVSRCRELRTRKGSTPEMQFSVRTLRTIAGRISGLKRDAAADERELAKLIGEPAPQLLRQPGISTVLAAEIYNAWSHPFRGSIRIAGGRRTHPCVLWSGGSTPAQPQRRPAA
jgi:transposase